MLVSGSLLRVVTQSNPSDTFACTRKERSWMLGCHALPELQVSTTKWLCGGQAAWLWLQLQSLRGMVFIDTCPSDGDHCCYWHSNTHIKREGTRVVCSSSYADSIPNLPYFGFKISVLAVQLRNLGLVLAGRGEDCK